MTGSPQSGDRLWLAGRLVTITLLLAAHPLPYDLRHWGIVVPPGTETFGYFVFEGLQFAIFSIVVFFWDALPGMRTIRAAAARVRIAMSTPPFYRQFAAFLAGAIATWGTCVAVLECIAALRDVAPAGEARFCAATLYFIVERTIVVLAFLVWLDTGKDPRERRRRVWKRIARRFHVAPVRTAASSQTA